jgi:hypothetical protein
MSRSRVESWVDRYVARIRIGEFLRRGAETLAAFLFLYGGVVLVVKLLIPQAWPHVLWGAIGAAPTLGLAWWWAQRNQSSRMESIARLDSTLNTGGLLMTLAELPDAEWSARLPQYDEAWKEAMPRFRPRRFAGYLALPLLFAVGACFMPLREAATAATIHNSTARQATQELEELLASLDEHKTLDEQEKEQLKEEVEKLAEETRESPLTHEKWETVDALRERMKIRLESAAMTSAQAREAAAMLAEGGAGDAPELSLERVEQLEQNLGAALQKLGQRGSLSGAPESLRDALQRASKSGQFRLPSDPSERQKFLEDLQDYLDQEQKKLSELRKKCAGCKPCEGNGQCEGQCEGEGNRPGRGGVTRGRGDAELTWGDESDKQGTKFKEVVLPRGVLDQPGDDLIGIQKTAPNEEAVAEAPRAAKRLMDPAAGEATWNRKLNPRHRNAVRKYFEDRSNTNDPK